MLVIEKTINSTSKPCHARRFNGDLHGFAHWVGDISPDRHYLRKLILAEKIEIPLYSFLVVAPHTGVSTPFQVLAEREFHQQFQLIRVKFERQAYFLKKGTPIIILPNGTYQAKHETLKYELLVDNWIAAPKILKVLVEPIMGHDWCVNNDTEFFITKHFLKASAYEVRSNLIQLEYPNSLQWSTLDLNDFNMAFIEARQV